MAWTHHFVAKVPKYLLIHGNGPARCKFDWFVFWWVILIWQTWTWHHDTSNSKTSFHFCCFCLRFTALIRFPLRGHNFFMTNTQSPQHIRTGISFVKRNSEKKHLEIGKIKIISMFLLLFLWARSLSQLNVSWWECWFWTFLMIFRWQINKFSWQKLELW